MWESGAIKSSLSDWKYHLSATSFYERMFDAFSQYRTEVFPREIPRTKSVNCAYYGMISVSCSAATSVF